MPKEQITRPLYTRQHDRYEEHDCPDDCWPCSCPEYGVARTSPSLAVRWQRGGGSLPDGTDTAHVGIALTEHEDVPWVDYWERHNTQTEPYVTAAKTDHYSRTLTRAEINTLIAVLRKARDAAYGRDE